MNVVTRNTSTVANYRSFRKRAVPSERRRAGYAETECV